MAIVEITSNQNQKIKDLVKLRNRRTREQERLMILEGYREVSRALEQGFVFKEFYFSKEYFLGENEGALLDKISESGCQMFDVAETIFPKIAYRDRPEGLIALMEFFDTSIEKIKLSANPLILVVESIEKPGNLGTMLRTADAAGVDALIICDRKTDIFNPNVIRASTGALFSVPIAESTTEVVLAWLKKNNINTVAADPFAKDLYFDIDYKGSTAFILGAEQFGLSQKIKSSADTLVNIPMKGLADSLNVSQAGTILLFEANRQRSS
ncbi:MAG: rRNA methyltransferase [Planctomycetota bacterium]|nr:MAG: rRNA methyltransferase [Planctomycetota bacterium]